MDGGDTLCCLLCQRSEETKVTGALSTKDEVTAHQNCLLFSSGLFCQSSPEFDDLFGFSVDAVLDEVKRGCKLMCYTCKKRGATVGCEVKRCKKSYHYPCAAASESIKIEEDTQQEKYVLFCPKHNSQAEENNLVNGHTSSSSTPSNPSEGGPSKVYCLTCEKTEGHIFLESLSNSIVMLYCDKHAPLSQKRNSSGNSTPVQRMSSYSSDSNSSTSAPRSSSKRQLISSDTQEEVTPSKRKSKSWNRIDESAESDENEDDSGMAMFAPLESDIDESLNSVREAKLSRNNSGSPTGSASGNQLEGENREEEETVIHSDAASESLLPLPVSEQSVPAARSAASSQPATALDPRVMEKTTGEKTQYKEEESCPEPAPGPSVPPQSSAGPPSPPDHFPPVSVTDSATSPTAPVNVCVSVPSPPSAPPPSDPGPSINSTKFWRNCNVAGCTQAIFRGFISEMNELCSRIQSDRASQDDYDIALSVMKASGKLAELVTQQQEELQRKQLELKKAAAMMEEFVSKLKR